MATENIIVTGFSPFGNHKVNASWETVKALKNLTNCPNLFIFEIPVEYDCVNDIIPSLWEKYDPCLVVHCGVSCYDKIVIESRANREGYVSLDSKQNLPPLRCLKSDSSDSVLCTEIDVINIRDEIIAETNLNIDVSNNAGRYLCEYIYYTSLKRDNRRTLFVHVPILGKLYNEKELAEGLLLIINKALKQICPCKQIELSKNDVMNL